MRFLITMWSFQHQPNTCLGLLNETQRTGLKRSEATQHSLYRPRTYRYRDLHASYPTTLQVCCEGPQKQASGCAGVGNGHVTAHPCPDKDPRMCGDSPFPSGTESI